MSVEINDEFVLNSGILVRVVAKKKTERHLCNIICADVNENEYAVREVYLKKGEIDWPFAGEVYHRYRADIGTRCESKFDGFYTILDQNCNRVTIEWENTKRKAIVNVSRIFDKSVRDVVEGHYVYAASYNDEIVYIGKGYEARYKHCTSGTSHVYELNELHFNGDTVEVEIIKDDMLAHEAFEYERELILEKMPKFNKVFAQLS